MPVTDADRSFADRMRLQGVNIDPEDVARSRENPSPFGHADAARTGWRPGDLVEAHSQVLAHRWGDRRPPQDRHPHANELLDLGRLPGERDLILDYLGPQARAWSPGEVLAAGTQHVSEVLTNTVNGRVFGRMPRLIDKVLKITAPTEVADFRPAPTGTVELDVAIDSPTEALQNWTTATVRSTAENLQLRIRPIRVRYSEQLRVNDSIGVLQAHVDAIMTAAGQNEATDVFSILTDGVTLADGSDLFDATAGSLVTGQSKDAAGLNAGLAALRGQQYNGKNADVEPRYLLCPAGDELTVRALVASGSTSADFVEVIPSAYVAAGDWILMGEPAVWPVVVRATQAGSNGQSLRFGPGSPNEREGLRDLVFEGSHVVDFGAIGRVGICKIEVS